MCVNIHTNEKITVNVLYVKRFAQKNATLNMWHSLYRNYSGMNLFSQKYEKPLHAQYIVIFWVFENSCAQRSTLPDFERIRKIVITVTIRYVHVYFLYDTNTIIIVEWNDTSTNIRDWSWILNWFLFYRFPSYFIFYSSIGNYWQVLWLFGLFN